MNIRRGILALSMTILASMAAREAAAEPIWKMLLPKKVEADPKKEYVMTEDNGPWMVMATTFSGDGAETQARELVLELRKRFKLEAYTHKMKFDFSEDVQGLGLDKTGQPARMKYVRDREIREIAVVVGNFSAVDAPEAQSALERIKFLRPDALDAEKRKKTNQSLAGLRRVQAALLPDGDERKQKGPMGKAFVCRNPMIPVEYFVPQGMDEFVERINADVKYSLLTCPGKYTVKVATFAGRVVIDQKEVEAYEHGAKMESRLEKAGENAEKLAAALRSKGYDAFVLHDRTASMVTVGSFNSYGSQRADGMIEIEPRMQAIMKQFAAKPMINPNGLPNDPSAQATMKPEVIVGIPLDIQPQIVHVPKKSISQGFTKR